MSSVDNRVLAGYWGATQAGIGQWVTQDLQSELRLTCCVESVIQLPEVLVAAQGEPESPPVQWHDVLVSIGGFHCMFHCKVLAVQLTVLLCNCLVSSWEQHVHVNKS